tara:strand:+ start:813 stop:1199 length:387 start_codon:yes stop_codon:yes gene_type:complete
MNREDFEKNLIETTNPELWELFHRIAHAVTVMISADKGIKWKEFTKHYRPEDISKLLAKNFFEDLEKPEIREAQCRALTVAAESIFKEFQLKDDGTSILKYHYTPLGRRILCNLLKKFPDVISYDIIK